MVHVPLYASEAFRGKSGQGIFADVVMEVDWSVGEIMKAVEDIGIRTKHVGCLHQRQRTLALLRNARRQGDTAA